MGCCAGAGYRDPEIDGANSINQLIEVIEKKIDIFGKEKDEIQAYLNDSENNKITSIETSNITIEDLQKRIPYLQKLSEGFEECVDKMKSTPNLPLNETKEQMQKIFSNYFVSYDASEGFKNDIADFKKLCSNVK